MTKRTKLASAPRFKARCQSSAGQRDIEGDPRPALVTGRDVGAEPKQPGAGRGGNIHQPAPCEIVVVGHSCSQITKLAGSLGGWMGATLKEPYAKGDDNAGDQEFHSDVLHIRAPQRRFYDLNVPPISDWRNGKSSIGDHELLKDVA